MRKINARSCEIRDIDKGTYKEFCEANHTQGYARAEIICGLYFGDELVQVVSLGKPRFNKNYQWELIRDCSKKDCSIRGGLSKLWKYIIDNNTISSCICYSYPHNDSLYSDKYVKYLGFENKKRAKKAKKLYFEGEWGGEHKRYSKSILEQQGVDRLLKGDFGHDKTNEQILANLGFEKVFEDGLDPQVDIYFPFGIVYKITDADTGEFYIGETLNKKKWEAGYLGSGTLWQRHINKHKDHKYIREVLYEADTPNDMYEEEVREIRKYAKVNEDGSEYVDHSTGCMNIDTKIHGMNARVCPECGGVNGMHKKTCSKTERCPECGGFNNNHKAGCSRAIICPDCGGINNKHKVGCLRARVCPECGGVEGHHRTGCSKAKICPECGGVEGKHRKTCSKYKEKTPCKYCGSIGVRHKSNCPLNKSTIKVCPECGGLAGNHKSTCSKYSRTPCPECGNLGSHKRTCSKFVSREVCPECGGIGQHKKSCSKYVENKRCPFCGSISRHKNYCPLHKQETEICSECGGTAGHHKKGCSKYNNPKSVCPECGSSGNHKRTCSHYSVSVCPICGGLAGNHNKNCINYKERKACPECGSRGSSHKKTCSHYKAKEPCPECGSMSRHKPGCSIGEMKRKNRRGSRQ